MSNSESIKRDTPAKISKRAGVSITKVSELSGINPATLYRWNDSKSFVFDAVVKEAADQDSGVHHHRSCKACALRALVRKK